MGCEGFDLVVEKYLDKFGGSFDEVYGVGIGRYCKARFFKLSLPGCLGCFLYMLKGRCGMHKYDKRRGCWRGL